MKQFSHNPMPCNACLVVTAVIFTISLTCVIFMLTPRELGFFERVDSTTELGSVDLAIEATLPLANEPELLKPQIEQTDPSVYDPMVHTLHNVKKKAPALEKEPYAGNPIQSSAINRISEHDKTVTEEPRLFSNTRGFSIKKPVVEVNGVPGFTLETSSHELPQSATTHEPSVPEETGQVNAPGLDHLVFYAWQRTDLPHITTAALLTHHDTAAGMLGKVRRAWEGVPANKRCIMIAPWQSYQGPPYEDAELVDLVKNGPNLDHARRWWAAMAWTLNENELAPHRIGVDWETGMTYWHIKGSNDPDQSMKFIPVWEDPEALNKLPADIRKLDPARMDYRINRPGIIAWNQFAAELRNVEIRGLYLDPIRQYFPQVRLTNYRDHLHNGEATDANGWPIPQTALTSESSPNLYRKNVDDNLKLLRTAIAAGGPMPVPWVSFPSYVGRDVWEDTIRGAHQLGIREFLYWNPNIPEKLEGDDEFADRVIAEINELIDSQAFASFD